MLQSSLNQSDHPGTKWPLHYWLVVQIHHASWTGLPAERNGLAPSGRPTAPLPVQLHDADVPREGPSNACRFRRCLCMCRSTQFGLLKRHWILLVSRLLT